MKRSFKSLLSISSLILPIVATVACAEKSEVVTDNLAVAPAKVYENIPTPKPVIEPTKVKYESPELLEKKVPPKRTFETIDRNSNIVIQPNSTYTISSTHYKDHPSGIAHGKTYTSDMFKYFVENTIYQDHHKVTDEEVIELIRYFEKNVNYGPGAHIVFNGSTFARVDKFTIAFIGSTQVSSSFGSSQHAEISCWSAPHDAGSSFVSSKGMITLHEYGHHETMVDSQLYVDKASYMDMFKGFKESLLAYEPFAELPRYFDKQHNSTGAMAFQAHSVNTVFGPYRMNSPYWNDLNYTFDKGEMATRLNLILSSSDNPSGFVNGNYGSYDIGAFINNFGFTPFDNDEYISNLIRIYKESVFGINSFDASKLIFTNDNSSLELANIDDSNLFFDKVKVSVTPKESIIGQTNRYFRYRLNSAEKIFNECKNIDNPYACHLPVVENKTIVETADLSNGLAFNETSWRFNTNYSDSNVEMKNEGRSYFIDKSKVSDKFNSLLDLVSGYGNDFNWSIEFINGTKTIKTING